MTQIAEERAERSLSEIVAIAAATTAAAIVSAAAANRAVCRHVKLHFKQRPRLRLCNVLFDRSSASKGYSPNLLDVNNKAMKLRMVDTRCNLRLVSRRRDGTGHVTSLQALTLFGFLWFHSHFMGDVPDR